MSFLGQSILNFSKRINVFQIASRECRSFHSITFNPNGTKPETSTPGGLLYNIFIRNNIRVHFPRPSERKRIKKHGWQTRMSTPGGRKVLMRRILKGRFYYSH